MEGKLLICSLAFGLAIAGAVALNRSNYLAGVDYLERILRERLRTFQIAPARLRRWIHTWLAASIALFAGVALALHNIPFAIFCAVLLSFGPWYIIRVLHARRRQKIEDQLADAMGIFASATQAGLSIAQAMQLLATECPLPIRQEFAQLSAEYSLGKPLEKTLAEAQQRLKSEHFSLFSAAVLASRQSGGKLNEIVDRIARSVRELQRLKRKVLSETAQARKSALYMAIAPSVILTVYYIVDPDATRLLFMTLPGQIILTIAAVLNVLAWLWARNILQADL
jgi:tight adherence protein B